MRNGRRVVRMRNGGWCRHQPPLSRFRSPCPERLGFPCRAWVPPSASPHLKVPGRVPAEALRPRSVPCGFLRNIAIPKGPRVGSPSKHCCLSGSPGFLRGIAAPAGSRSRFRPWHRCPGWFPPASFRGIAARSGPRVPIAYRYIAVPIGSRFAVPSPEARVPPDALRESGFGIGRSLCLALLPSGALPSLCRQRSLRISAASAEAMSRSFLPFRVGRSRPHLQAGRRFRVAPAKSPVDEMYNVDKFFGDVITLRSRPAG